MVSPDHTCGSLSLRVSCERALDLDMGFRSVKPLFFESYENINNCSDSDTNRTACLIVTISRPNMAYASEQVYSCVLVSIINNIYNHVHTHTH